MLQGVFKTIPTLKSDAEKIRYTIKSTAYQTANGQSGGVLGLLTFQPPDPTACSGSPGVTSATISGFTGIGSAS